MKMRNDQVFKISPDVLFQEVSGETVLLDLASENYFGLDEVGTRIWVLLNEGKNSGQILDVLINEYEVERSVLAADIEELLQGLIEAGLIGR